MSGCLEKVFHRIFVSYFHVFQDRQTEPRTLFITLAGSKNNLSSVFSFRDLFHKVENEWTNRSCYIATFSNFGNMLQSIFYFVKRKRFNAKTKINKISRSICPARCHLSPLLWCLVEYCHHILHQSDLLLSRSFTYPSHWLQRKAYFWRSSVASCMFCSRIKSLVFVCLDYHLAFKNP